MLEDEEEELAASLRDLGDQRLKDIDRPVRLYQVAAPGLREDFPPPRVEAPPSDALEATIARPVWRRRPVVAAAALVLLALVAVAAFFATRGSGGGLSGVHANHVGFIDPKTNEIVGEVQVGIRPGPVAAGEGAVWVGNLEERTLTKIDEKRRTVAATYPLGNRTSTGIAVGFDSVWVAHGALGQLTEVDPEFGTPAEPIDVAGEALGAPSGAVTVGAGAVWAVYGDSTLARVGPSSATVRRTVTGPAPAGVVVDDSGSVWVVNSHDSTVQGFQPDTFEEGDIGVTPVGRRPTAITAGSSAIWVANTGEDTITRIEPGTAGAAPAAEPIRVGDAPSALAVGARAVWVANAGDGTVSRIDIAKREVVEKIDVGNAPSGISFADGLVWVAVQAPPR